MTKYDVTDLAEIFAHESEAVRPAENVSMADFDEGTYRPYLDGLDLTDEQAAELMRIVWSIMRMFVEMDLPIDSCGQVFQSIIDPTNAGHDSLD